MDEFDYVIVGSGTAGSVLANRLSADPGVSVLVLEAGHGRIPSEVDDSRTWFQLLGGQIDWGYQSMRQSGLDGRQTFEPRGKAPGGSSNLYIMMHVRGHPSDFDNWAYQGAAGWSYADLAPFFDRLEQTQKTSHAGLHGPNPASLAFLDACSELGYRRLESFNAGDMFGAGWHRLDVVDARRQGVLVSYLTPALDRPNVTLRTGAQATRLLVEHGRCTGIEYVVTAEPSGALGRVVRDGHSSPVEPGTYQARARAEVIVSGGAIESPKLLLLSGIGDPAALREHGIDVVAAVPGVGENFHNHILTGLIAEARSPVPPPAQNLSESALFLASQPGLPAPDLQLAFVHVPFDIIVGREHPNAVSILPGVVRPASRGWIRLAGPDPLAKPLVNPNYLADRSDEDRLVQGVRLAREIFNTNAFSDWNKQELSPGPAVDSDEELRAFVRRTADSYHHQAGSCRMGIDDLSVVDPSLRVHGVSGLRVVDASVMPAVPSGNCHAAIAAIAERAADLITGSN
jgi:choline dehydrogenase